MRIPVAVRSAWPPGWRCASRKPVKTIPHKFPTTPTGNSLRGRRLSAVYSVPVATHQHSVCAALAATAECIVVALQPTVNYEWVRALVVLKNRAWLEVWNPSSQALFFFVLLGGQSRALAVGRTV